MTNSLIGAQLHAGSVIWPVLAGLLVRTSLAAAAALFGDGAVAFHAPDSDRYLALSQELLQTGRFAYADQPELYRTPGYPLLLIPGLLFGYVAYVTVALQVVVGTATVYVIYRIGQETVDATPSAIAAAWLLALEPLSSVYAAQLLTEVPYTFFIYAGVLCLLRYLATHDVKILSVGALSFVVATFLRPVAVYVPALVALGLVIYGAKRGIVRTIRHAVVFLLLAITPIGLWCIRNYAVADYVGFSGVSDLVIYFHHAGAIRAAQAGRPLPDLKTQVDFLDSARHLPSQPQQVSWSAGARYRWMRDQGLEVLAQNPFSFARMYAVGLGFTLLNPGASPYLDLFGIRPGERADDTDTSTVDTAVLRGIMTRPYWWVLAVPFVGFVLSYVGAAAIGLVRSARGRTAPVLVLVLTFAYHWFLSGGANATSRFRHPMMPAICVFAGVGILYLSHKLLRPRRDLSGTPRSTPR